ncbi:2-deoxy-5-keto-D-gluconate 6-phosphate aldolase domain-containing protein [Paramicrobacterium chengjingii]|uniref:DUF2090 domain-containing protein n=1 Tax=Paramicrobacterium chengjingii TaxID=2769067 RepID=A0ABX6YHF6_9MICO|nr:DUF2090 domain-containing protein [Microbacterium chengjingii]QPZ38244.1 DUF2090 domain-containing protein [Microbacterium chengjingii]
MSTLFDPIHILAFDHRQVLRDMLGTPDESEAAAYERLSDGKQLVAEAAAELAASGAAGVGLLIDEEYGADAARFAADNGVTLAMPVEASRTKIIEYQYGDDYPQHVTAFGPDIVKLLVFHNPGDDAERQRIQFERTLEVSRWCKQNDYALMLEILLPATPEQLDSVDGSNERFVDELQTELLRESIKQYQDAGIEPDLWKVVGLPSAADFKVVAGQARADGRDHVGCIVLGNGAGVTQVETWLATAAGVEGFTGFAVGRSIWFEPLKAYYFDGLSRDEARARIVNSFSTLIRAFSSGR